MPYTTWIKHHRISILCVLLFLLAGAWFVVSRLPVRDSSIDIGSLSATPAGVREALRTVYDWELEINLIDLGLIRDITVNEEGEAEVRMIFTSAFCPYTVPMIAEVKKVAGEIPGINRVRVRVDESVNWEPEMMSDEARARFKGRWQ